MRRHRSLALWIIAPAVMFAAGCVDGGSGPPAKPPLTIVVDAGPDQQIEAGDTLALGFQFTQTPDTTGPWSYYITWGDGDVSAGAATIGVRHVVKHVYAAAGTFTTTVKVERQSAAFDTDVVMTTVTAATLPTVTLLAAGDIGECGLPYSEQSAVLVEGIPGTVATLGDNAYPNGSDADFANCYHPSWGRLKARTRPAIGNHEYGTPGAAGYFRYFGAAAGTPGQGWYSYNIGAWHIIALNSNLNEIDAAGQEQWLRADLAANPRTCTLAYFHHPRFNSGVNHGNEPFMEPIWRILYDAGADVVLSGHEHIYERFGPQTPSGVADAARGIRQFTVGTGGGGSYTPGPQQPNSEAITREHGVLKLTLAGTGYTWEFVPVPGSTFRDSGSGTCH